MQPASDSRHCAKLHPTSIEQSPKLCGALAARKRGIPQTDRVRDILRFTGEPRDKRTLHQSSVHGTSLVGNQLVFCGAAPTAPDLWNGDARR